MPKEEKEKAKKLVIVEEVASDETVTPSDTPVVEDNNTEDLKTIDTKESETIKKEENSSTLEVKENEKISEKKEEDSKKEVKEEKKEESEKPNYLWIIIPTALLVGALVGGLITYFSGVSKLDKDEVIPTPISSEAPEAESSPEATSAATLKRDILKIQVLNGSGVSGAAGKAKTYLEDLGYQDVDTGNASVSDLTETEISIKEEMEEYTSLLTSDLSEDYQVADSVKTLVTTSKYDVVITLGKK